MLKVILPFSGMAALVVYFLGIPLWGVALIAGTVELAGGITLLIKLQHKNRFRYDSFYGKLLGQFTASNTVDLEEMQILVGTRLLALTLLGFNFLYSIPAIVLFAFSTIHWVPKKKARV